MQRPFVRCHVVRQCHAFSVNSGSRSGLHVTISRTVLQAARVRVAVAGAAAAGAPVRWTRALLRHQGQDARAAERAPTGVGVQSQGEYSVRRTLLFLLYVPGYRRVSIS